MRALLPNATLGVDLLDWYGRDWLEPGGIRANFISSADGGAAVDGRSKGLQVAGDNEVFSVLRTLADVVVAGSGTVTTEGYQPIELSAERQEQRLRRGIAETLPTAVISRSCHVDPGLALFTEAPENNRSIVLTCASADPTARRALQEVADVVDCGDQDIEPERMRGALAARGLFRVLCEGGPTAFAGLAERGGIDELCLTLAPRLAGPGAGRISAGAAWDRLIDLELIGLLENDGALFIRYAVSK